MEKSDIGLIGLAVMGENLALNLQQNGWKVSVWNRTVSGVEEGVVRRFIQGRGKDKNIQGFDSLDDFVSSLHTPRVILIMVRAGEPVQQVIDLLLPYLSNGDIIIDGGNSDFHDTMNRVIYLEKKGICFVGAGISGGEEGALKGASIMPGGCSDAWPVIKPILQSIAAKDEEGNPCCEWIGSGGSGHYVKMIHNAIEYSDMQLIAESYAIMRHLTDLSHEEMSRIFAKWNDNKLNSYLINITSRILSYRDKYGEYLLDNILDVAGQKGMAKWAVMDALEKELPFSMTATAIFERDISLKRTLRERASGLYYRRNTIGVYNSQELVNSLYNALYASRLVSYIQAFNLLDKASEFYGWEIEPQILIRLWKNGSVIRSQALMNLETVFDDVSKGSDLILNKKLAMEIKEALPFWKRTVAIAVKEEISTPALATALNYFYSITNDKLPMNLIQAQRDYFGAHTFERIDSQRGDFFHENWSGQDSISVSGVYNA